MESMPRKNPDIIWKNVQGETVLLNPVSGKYFGLNKVGCAFWEKVDGVRTMGDIAALLLEEFEVEEERLRRDLEALVKALVEKELLSFE